MTCVAAIQMNSSSDLESNLVKAKLQLETAGSWGADIAVLPECFALLPLNEAQRFDSSTGSQLQCIETFLAETARKFAMWIVSAGVFTPSGTDGKIRNTCFVHDRNGSLVTQYDKIHLFDIQLPDGESHAESDYTEAGEDLVVVETPAGMLGLTICYDVRFPQMYRELALLGAQWFVVPSAFTEQTGHAHWEVLLRARAIENLAYVVAPAQYGLHDSGRRTYGHSLMIDPWGRILAEKDVGSGVIFCEIDSDWVNDLRRSLPFLTS